MAQSEEVEIPLLKNKSQEISFEDAINLTGFGKYNYYISLVCGFIAGSVLLVGLDLSYTLPAALCDLELTPSSKAVMSSSVFLGTMCASHLSGLLIDVLGRQYVMVRSLFLVTCLYILIAFAPNFTTFAVLKILTGFVICPCGVAIFAYLGESCPSDRISLVIIITTTFASVFMTYCTSVAWLILTYKWALDLGLFIFHPWRLFLLVCGIPAMTATVLMGLLPESPKFNVACGKKEKALETLRMIYRVNKGLPRKDFPVNCIADLPGENVALAKKLGDIFRRMWSQTYPLFLPPYLLKVFICSFIYFNIYFCINGLLLWVPEMSNRMALSKSTSPNKSFTLCEMMEIVTPTTQNSVELSTPYSYLLNPANITMPSSDDTVFYSNHPEECVIDIKEEIFLPNLLMAIVQPLGMILVSLIIPLFRKKVAIMLFLLIACALMIIVTLIPNTSLIMTIFTLMPPVLSVVYNVITSLTVDFFPTNYRGMAVSLCMMFGRTGSIIGNFFFSFMLDTNCVLVFYLFAGILFLAIIVTSVIKTAKPTKASLT